MTPDNYTLHSRYVVDLDLAYVLAPLVAGRAERKGQMDGDLIVYENGAGTVSSSGEKLLTMDAYANSEADLSQVEDLMLRMLIKVAHPNTDNSSWTRV